MYKQRTAVSYKKFSIAALKESSVNKPEGYYEEVLSYCEQDGDILRMPIDKWVEMRNKYTDVTHSNPEDMDQSQIPDLKDMVKSMTKSMANWAGSGFKIAPKEVFDQRLNECKVCPHWDSEALANTGRCMVCGCSTVAKLRLATEKCPIGKW